MATAHSTITGADNHEPKGVEGASANTAYFANGSGSGAWGKVNAARLDTASILNVNKGRLYVTLADVSAPSSIYIPIPGNATVTLVTTALQGAITLADSTVTAYNHAGNSMGSTVVAFTGSAAGDVDIITPVTNNTFTAGQVMRITTDGNSTTTAALIIAVDYTWT